jgi:ABC-type antimicrobial peptide transport system permease subunit
VVFLNFIGFEKALMVGFENGTDLDQVKQEIDQRDDVRKSLEFRANNGFTIGDDDLNAFQIYAYKNFDELENLLLGEGRFPIHENEVLIGKGLVDQYNLSVGDSVLLKYNGIEKNCIVSGTANVMMNNGRLAYMTFDGFRQFMPATECGNYLFVYPADGVSDNELKASIIEDYGSIEDTAGKSEDSTGEESDLEERIRAKADEQMAVLMSKYGVSNASYAIKIGDKIISGNSGGFKITEISSIAETIDAQMGGLSVMSQIFSVVLMIIICLIISIILNFLIESTIKKERQAMGIEKAMGYTSKDLRKQIVIRIMPVAIPAIIIGAAFSVPLVILFMKCAFMTAFGIRLIWVPVVAVIITVYVYFSTYISAGKVKKVSVTELMTE